jgi:hypothetical protein
MPHDLIHNTPLSDRQDGDLLDDLELRCRADVSTARSLASCRRKVGVTVRAANVIDRDQIAVTGHTVELRRQGAVCIASRPTMVGSCFQLAFDQNELGLAPILAVCDRCAMLGDASFELGFKFVHEIDLSPLPPGTQGR